MGVRKLRPNRKKGAPYHAYLLFKDADKRDSCREWIREKDGSVTMTSFKYQQALINFSSTMDLPYTAQVYALARSPEELDDLLAIGPSPIASTEDIMVEILDYKQYPPVLNRFPKPTKIVRSMQCVEFDTDWISSFIARGSHGALASWMRRLELMMLSFLDGSHPGVRSHFVTEIWPSAGKMNQCMRSIARAAEEQSGSTKVTSDVETFGPTKSRLLWRVVLELELEEPRYSKWIA